MRARDKLKQHLEAKHKQLQPRKQLLKRLAQRLELEALRRQRRRLQQANIVKLLREQADQLKLALQRKQAQAALHDAAAAARAVEHELAQVQELQRGNDVKKVLLKNQAGMDKQLEVMDMPLMLDAPDWRGDTQWESYQEVIQRCYTLQHGKLLQTSSSSINLRVAKKHFAAGGFRYVFYAQCAGKRFVAKRLYAEGDDLADNMKDVESDIKDHLVAAASLDAFQVAAASAGAKISAAHFTASPSVVVVKSDTALATSGHAVLFLEPYVPGNFCKWVHNTGLVAEQPSASNALAHDTAQAFAHHSYASSFRHCRQDRLIITDVQGFHMSDGTCMLIDPAVCRPIGKDDYRSTADYGLDNAVHTFYHSHTCSNICTALALGRRTE